MKRRNKIINVSTKITLPSSYDNVLMNPKLNFNGLAL